MMKTFVLTSLLAALCIAAEAQNKTRNVVMISVDGCRWQEIFRGADSVLFYAPKYRQQDSAAMVAKYWGKNVAERRNKLMPFFWNTISKQGQLYGNRDLGNLMNVRNKYWFSYPGRSETLCGYYDEKVNSNDYPNNPNENVLEFFNKQKGMEGKVVTFASWDALSRILNRDRNGMLVNIPGEKVKGNNLTQAQKLANELQNYLPEYFGKSVRFDAHTYALTRSYIEANHPRVVHIDFADMDEFGHHGQYDSFLDGAHYVDAMVASLWNFMQADPFYKDKTTIIVYPDHGRGTGDRWTSHGTSAPGSNETWMAIIGPDTPGTGEMKSRSQVYQDQFAQTVAQLMGLKFTANHPVGEPVSTVFK